MLSQTSPSARRTSVSIAMRHTTLRRTSCGCRASLAATCTPSPPSPWTLSPGRTSPLPSFLGNSWSSGRSWGRGSLARWACGRFRGLQSYPGKILFHPYFIFFPGRSTCVRRRDSQNFLGKARPSLTETVTLCLWLLNSWGPTLPAKPGTLYECVYESRHCQTI